MTTPTHPPRRRISLRRRHASKGLTTTHGLTNLWPTPLRRSDWSPTTPPSPARTRRLRGHEPTYAVCATDVSRQECSPNLERGGGMTLEDNEWTQLAQRSPVGRVMLQSLEHDLGVGAVSSDVLDKFFTYADAACVGNSDWIGPLSMAPDVIPECIPNGTTVPFERPARVVDAEDFFAWNVDRISLTWLGAIQDRWVRELTGSLGPRPDGTRRVKGMVRGRLPFAFVTQSRWLASRQSGPEPARVARQSLGLCHMPPRTRMFAVHYPDVSVPLRRPTVLHCGGARCYRSRVGADGWGVARDLDNAGAPGPEALADEQPLGPEFSLIDLGSVPDDVRTPSDAELETE